MKKNIILILCLAFAGYLGAQQPKNILIILSDDQSWNTLHAWGNQDVRTPNLDNLVKEGLSFRQAHVMGGHQGAVCIPSRAMLLTGRYINRLPNDGSSIPDSLISLPEILRSRGYATFHAGKWHSDKASHHRMFSTGASIFFGGMHHNQNGGQAHPEVFDYDPTGQYEKEKMRHPDTFSTELYANAAIRFLNAQKNSAKPFLCYLALTSPHDPRTPPEAFQNLYDPAKIPLPKNFLLQHPFDNGDLNVRDETLLPVPRNPDAVKKEIALYYGMVSEMDAQVGRVLAALKANGLDDNTIVVFAGDNGLAVGQHGLLGKQNLYEHSIRVPLIVRGPGIPKSAQTNSFTYLSDIAPTILAYLGLDAPPTMEGKSFYTLFKNPEQSLRPQLYNVYGHWSRSLKTKDHWKLIEYNVKGVRHTQLFNLKKDPLEIHNLAEKKKYAKKVAKLRQLLQQEMKTTHDNLDLDKPDWGRTPQQKAFGS